jgi:hypothetical protein
MAAIKFCQKTFHVSEHCSALCSCIISFYGICRLVMLIICTLRASRSTASPTSSRTSRCPPPYLPFSLFLACSFVFTLPIQSRESQLELQSIVFLAHGMTQSPSGALTCMSLTMLPSTSTTRSAHTTNSVQYPFLLLKFLKHDHLLHIACPLLPPLKSDLVRCPLHKCAVLAPALPLCEL